MSKCYLSPKGTGLMFVGVGLTHLGLRLLGFSTCKVRGYDLKKKE